MEKEDSIKNEEVPRSMGAFLLFVLKKIFQKKKYWLLIVWSLLAALAIIIFLSGGSTLIPAIYMTF